MLLEAQRAGRQVVKSGRGQRAGNLEKNEVFCRRERGVLCRGVLEIQSGAAPRPAQGRGWRRSGRSRVGVSGVSSLFGMRALRPAWPAPSAPPRRTPSGTGRPRCRWPRRSPTCRRSRPGSAGAAAAMALRRRQAQARHRRNARAANIAHLVLHRLKKVLHLLPGRGRLPKQGAARGQARGAQAAQRARLVTLGAVSVGWGGRGGRVGRGRRGGVELEGGGRGLSQQALALGGAPRVCGAGDVGAGRGALLAGPAAHAAGGRVRGAALGAAAREAELRGGVAAGGGVEAAGRAAQQGDGQQAQLGGRDRPLPTGRFRGGQRRGRPAGTLQEGGGEGVIRGCGEGRGGGRRPGRVAVKQSPRRTIGCDPAKAAARGDTAAKLCL